MTKTCCRCGEGKPSSQFNFKNREQNKRFSYCRSCQQSYQRELYAKGRKKKIRKVRQRRQEIRAFLHDYLASRCCADCEEADPVVLDFDHVRGKKRFNISEAALRGFSRDTLLEELAKCEIVCANCHRRRTSKQQGWSKRL